MTNVKSPLSAVFIVLVISVMLVKTYSDTDSVSGIVEKTSSYQI
jgi:hypothetical protein